MLKWSILKYLVLLCILTTCKLQPEIYPSNQEDMKQIAETKFMNENQLNFLIRESFLTISTLFSNSILGDVPKTYTPCGAKIDNSLLHIGLVNIIFNVEEICNSSIARSGIVSIKSMKGDLRLWNIPNEIIEISFDKISFFKNNLPFLELHGKLYLINTTLQPSVPYYSYEYVFTIRGDLIIKSFQEEKKCQIFRKINFKSQPSTINQSTSIVELTGDSLWNDKKISFLCYINNELDMIETIDDTVKYDLCSNVWTITKGEFSYYNSSNNNLYKIKYGLDSHGNTSKFPCLGNYFSISWKTERSQTKTLILEYNH